MSKPKREVNGQGREALKPLYGRQKRQRRVEEKAEDREQEGAAVYSCRLEDFEGIPVFCHCCVETLFELTLVIIYS